MIDRSEMLPLPEKVGVKSTQISGTGNEKEKPLPQLRQFSQVEEKPLEFYVGRYILKCKLTVTSADGGSGKTWLECDLVAAATTGRPSRIFEHDEGSVVKREPGNVLIFSEEGIDDVLKARLRKAGADQARVYGLSADDPGFENLTFDNPQIGQLIELYKPQLVIFDPLQCFLGDRVDMGRRNVMRRQMTPLLKYCKQYNTTILVLSHTNKKDNASGRGRVSDSSEIWDAARSLLMVGKTGDKTDDGEPIRYVSSEKSNYVKEGDCPTILFTIDDRCGAVYYGSSELHDIDYQAKKHKAQYMKESSGKRSQALDDAKEEIIEYLREYGHEGTLSTDLQDYVKSQGISMASFKRARGELQKEGRVKTFNTGYGKEKKFYIRITAKGEEWKAGTLSFDDESEETE